MELNNIEFRIPDYKKSVEEAKKQAKERLTKKEELQRLIGYIDLTTLSGDDRRSVVEKLVDRAVQPWDQDKSVHCAAVCVYPARILDATNRLKSYPNNKVHVASGK
jgi:deoxyribose-phosphate aldolase